MSIKLKLAVIMAVAGLLLVPAGRMLESVPEFCGSCHEMKPAYSNWQSSGASRSHTDCIMCHSGPGIAGVIEAEYRGFKQLVIHFTKDELIPPFEAKVPDIFCTKCHKIADIRAVHEKISMYDKKNCAYCHRHGESSEFAGDIPG